MRRISTHLAALAAVTLLGAGPASAMRVPRPPASTELPPLKPANYYEGRQRAQWKNETNKRGRNR